MWIASKMKAVFARCIAAAAALTCVVAGITGEADASAMTVRHRVTVVSMPARLHFSVQSIAVPADLRKKMQPGDPRYEASLAKYHRLGLTGLDPDSLRKFARAIGAEPKPSMTFTQGRTTVVDVWSEKQTPAGIKLRILGQFARGGYVDFQNGFPHLSLAAAHLVVPAPSPTPSVLHGLTGLHISVPEPTPTPNWQNVQNNPAPDWYPTPRVDSIEVNGTSSNAFHEGDMILLRGSGLGGLSQRYGQPFKPTIRVDFEKCGGFDLHVDRIADDGTWLIADAGDPQKDGILAVDQRVKPGYLYLTTPGGQAAPLQVAYVAWLSRITAKYTVWAVPLEGGDQHLFQSYSDDTLGIFNDHDYDTRSGGKRASAYPGWAGGQGGDGSDAFGGNTRLINGWQFLGAQATPFDTVSGGAGVTDSPDGSTLRTTVHWFYPADDRIYYYVNMTVEGPAFLRPTEALPSSGDCGNA